MKNKIYIFVIGIVILAAAVFIFSNFGGAKIIGNTISSKGEIQIVKLSVENGKYVMNPSEIKKGVPVRIEADLSKMPGCSKSIVISSFNVEKSFSNGDNTLEFTPDKAGTFNIMCSMNMYRGTFEVLEDNGSKSNYVEQITAIKSGGCGCGG